MLDHTIATGERVNRDVKIIALCPSLHGQEPMAEFALTLSIKKQLNIQRRLLNSLNPFLIELDFLDRDYFRAV